MQGNFLNINLAPMGLKIQNSPTFSRVAKKMHVRDKKILDQAVSEIAVNPAVGEEKRGDLSGVFVHKFKLNKRKMLLAYRLQPNKFKPTELVLLALGSHENFYADLKR